MDLLCVVGYDPFWPKVLQNINIGKSIFTNWCKICIFEDNSVYTNYPKMTPENDTRNDQDP